MSVEVLVYNVSHIDLILGVADELEIQKELSADGRKSPRDGEAFARPKFNAFNSISEKLKMSLEENVQGTKITSIRRSLHFDKNQRGGKTQVPIGFGFLACPLIFDSKKLFHFRHKRQDAQLPAVKKSEGEVAVKAIYLPLLAQMIFTWNQIIDARFKESEKHVCIITGAGRPRNKEDSEADNSTIEVGVIMEIFLKHFYPEMKVYRLDSGGGIFQYEHNVQFVRAQVLPLISKFRSPLTRSFGEVWREHLHLTISLTDGSPARLAALNASLRQYRPGYLHMWQLKTFWHEDRLTDSDLESLEFDNVETNPAVPVKKTDADVQRMVQEMVQYKEQFEQAQADGKAEELNTFWLRKTRKPVLSVLMTKKVGESPKFYRGMNVEVSMPTGSLCSERNVVGTALADDQTLLRRDFRMVAVLSMTLASPDEVLLDSPKKANKRPRLGSLASESTAINAKNRNPIQPCGACNEWLKKIAEINPDFKVITFPDSTCKQVYISEVV